ncbi:MAG: UDP-3-O-(3-hydroxymyristoyl)glucosamine N-acyltransferase, partial [Robiginitomaculum sp.]
DIADVSSLSKGEAGCVTYFENRAYAKDIAGSKASACFVKADKAALIIDAGMTALITDHPRAAFARAMDRLYSQIKLEAMEVFISASARISENTRIMPGAVIAQNVCIGANCEIGASAYIGPGVTIGDNTYIGANTSIECAIIGSHVRILSGASIGQAGFGVTMGPDGALDMPHIGNVIIHDHVSIGAQCAFDRGMLDDTVIGAHSKFDNFCQVAHNVSVGENCMFASFAGLSGSCVIENNVVMGGRVGLADHLVIGAGAQVAANAGVMKNIPAGEVWSGYPAKPLRQHMKEVATLARMVKKKPAK